MDDQNMQGQYAGFITRMVGVVIDLVLLYLTIIMVAWFTQGALSMVGIDVSNCPASNIANPFVLLKMLTCYGAHWFLVGLAAFGPLVYFVGFWTLGGQTIGDYIVGVKIVRSDGGDVGFVRAVIRWLGFLLCLLTFGIGFLWIIIDDKREGWHDKIAHTCVVYAWQARLNENTMNKVRRWLRHRQAKKEAKAAR
ncbi:MAG: RDD family protein [Anaerolineae bacterium]